MSGVNKAIIVGNLGADPIVNYTADGRAIARLSVATSEVWNDRNTGEKQERTEWHRVSMFGKLAEIAKEYLHKGSQVYIEGKIQTRKWQDKEGQDRYTTEIVVQGYGGILQMLGSRNTERTSSDEGFFNQDTQAGTTATAKNEAPIAEDDSDDDIPF